jgi:SWI/SNF-related matrix-associated actin-dependent regulator 1 of chromatin subfamily A
MKNRREGTCDVCGVAVAALQGELFGPPWKVKCALCAGTSEVVRIIISKEGANAVFNPSGYLGADRFDIYRVALAGAGYDGKRRVNFTPFDKALGMIEALKKGGFVVDVQPALVATLQAVASEIHSGVAAASDRAATVDARLRERGLYLFPFQKTGVRWLASRTNALLADEMGLGKTIQALIAIPEGAPTLVICPAVAKGVWERETAKWRPDLRVTLLSGRNSFRWPEAGEMIVVNYEILPKDMVTEKGAEPAPVHLGCLAGTVLIADEAHAIKNRKTQRAQRFRAISERVQASKGRTWLVTATPLLNKPQEMWSILQAANLHREAFLNWDGFVKVMNGWQSEYSWEWGTPNEARAAECLRKVSLRRMRKEVLPELPTKTYRTVMVEIDAKTRKICNALEKMLQTVIPRNAWELLMGKPSNPRVRPDDAFTKEDLDKARAIVGGLQGVSFEELSRARAALATAKIPALVEMIEQYEEQEEPLVVFSAHVAPIELLGEREGWACITGSTPNERRREIEDAFQAGKLKGIACTIKAGGVAITLTRASQMIFVSKEFTPALNEQAEDRIVRIGQTRGCVITSLYSDHPIDARLDELLAVKRKIIDASVNASGVGDDVEPYQIPDIDFDNLAAEAAEEARKADEARALAGERVKLIEGEKAKAAEEQERQRREALELIRKGTIHKLPEGWNLTENPARRLACNAREAWAAGALVTLTDLDPDRARARNDVGFNASDGGMGHRMTFEVLVEGLTDKQWLLAIALCTKYWRQVGRPPVL